MIVSYSVIKTLSISICNPPLVASSSNFSRHSLYIPSYTSGVAYAKTWLNLVITSSLSDIYRNKSWKENFYFISDFFVRIIFLSLLISCSLCSYDIIYSNFFIWFSLCNKYSSRSSPLRPFLCFISMSDYDI